MDPAASTTQLTVPFLDVDDSKRVGFTEDDNSDHIISAETWQRNPPKPVMKSQKVSEKAPNAPAMKKLSKSQSPPEAPKKGSNKASKTKLSTRKR
jgi:hypothetical protein